MWDTVRSGHQKMGIITAWSLWYQCRRKEGVEEMDVKDIEDKQWKQIRCVHRKRVAKIGRYRERVKDEE